MAKLIHITFKSMSLVETITAMVIIVSALGAGFSIFSKNGAYKNTILKTKAAIHSEELMDEIKKTQELNTDENTVEGIRYKISTGKYQEIEGLYLVQIEAYNASEKMIYETQKLVRKE